MKWSYRIGGTEEDPVMLVKTFVRAFGRHVDLHRMLRVDAPGCFHTHPAYAIRVVLHGGYVEEVYQQSGSSIWGNYSYLREILPGHIELVRPEYCHRIHKLINGRSSHSLWLRGPIVAEIKLLGWGWPSDALPYSADNPPPRV